MFAHYAILLLEVLAISDFECKFRGDVFQKVFYGLVLPWCETQLGHRRVFVQNAHDRKVIVALEQEFEPGNILGRQRDVDTLRIVTGCVN